MSYGDKEVYIEMWEWESKEHTFWKQLLDTIF